MRGLVAIAVMGLMALPSAPALADRRHNNDGGDRVRVHLTNDVPIVSRGKWEECKNLNAILQGEMEASTNKIELMRQCKMLRKR